MVWNIKRNKIWETEDEVENVKSEEELNGSNLNQLDNNIILSDESNEKELKEV